jgi:hypothetical protein
LAVFHIKCSSRKVASWSRPRFAKFHESLEIRLETEPQVATIAGDFAKQADGFEPVDDLAYAAPG